MGLHEKGILTGGTPSPMEYLVWQVLQFFKIENTFRFDEIQVLLQY